MLSSLVDLYPELLRAPADKALGMMIDAARAPR